MVSIITALKLDKAVTVDTYVEVEIGGGSAVQTNGQPFDTYANTGFRYFEGRITGDILSNVNGGELGQTYWSTDGQYGTALQRAAIHGATQARLGHQASDADYTLYNDNGQSISTNTVSVLIKAGEMTSESFGVRPWQEVRIGGGNQGEEGTENFTIKVKDGAHLTGTQVNVNIISNDKYIWTPIALDMNGDGKIGVTGETSSHQKDADAELGATVEFDIDGDGTLNTIEWFDGSGDGILVDSTKVGPNGEIDGNALFGDQGGQFANGYEKLATPRR